MPSTTYRQQKVGRTFENAVRKADISRQELADLLGVHQSSFTYWYKRGVTTPYAKTVAELLDLDVKTILSKVQMGRRKKASRDLRQKNGFVNDYSELITKPRAIKTEPFTPTTSIARNAISATTNSSGIAFELSPQRTVNIDLLGLVANMRLSVQQEDTLQSLALTFLGEKA
jgi:hypothetical protein